MATAAELIAALDLKPHPLEGGYYRETYRSPLRLPATLWPVRHKGDKAAGTAIYYLHTTETFSALHRLPTDEIFHFYLGDPVTMLQLLPDGTGRRVTLGSDILAGQSPQLMVPAGVWQGSFLQAGGTVALMGTTMAPGFDVADYEAGDRARLTAQYPAFADLIEQLTPQAG
jgi:predicted cupin superfamily sugar epimerase